MMPADHPNVELGASFRSTSRPKAFSTHRAQLAKQVIFQKVREAERDTVYHEYIGRVGEIVNATVKRIEGRM